MLLAQGPREDGLVVREPLLSARRRIERLVGLPRRVRGVRWGNAPLSAGRQSVFS